MGCAECPLMFYFSNVTTICQCLLFFLTYFKAAHHMFNLFIVIFDIVKSAKNKLFAVTFTFRGALNIHCRTCLSFFLPLLWKTFFHTVHSKNANTFYILLSFRSENFHCIFIVQFYEQELNFMIKNWMRIPGQWLLWAFFINDGMTCCPVFLLSS